MNSLYKRFRSHPWVFKLRMAWQRAWRGYSDEQCWNLHMEVAKLVVVGVQAIRRGQNSYPAELGSWESWDDVLRKIEKGFQLYVENDGFFPINEQPFKEAMANFAHWFGALWD